MPASPKKSNQDPSLEDQLRWKHQLEQTRVSSTVKQPRGNTGAASEEELSSNELEDDIDDEQFGKIDEFDDEDPANDNAMPQGQPANDNNRPQENGEDGADAEEKGTEEDQQQKKDDTASDSPKERDAKRAQERADLGIDEKQQKKLDETSANLQKNADEAKEWTEKRPQRTEERKNRGLEDKKKGGAGGDTPGTDGSHIAGGEGAIGKPLPDMGASGGAPSGGGPSSSGGMQDASGAGGMSGIAGGTGGAGASVGAGGAAGGAPGAEGGSATAAIGKIPGLGGGGQGRTGAGAMEQRAAKQFKQSAVDPLWEEIWEDPTFIGLLLLNTYWFLSYIEVPGTVSMEMWEKILLAAADILAIFILLSLLALFAIAACPFDSQCVKAFGTVIYQSFGLSSIIPGL